MNFYFLHLWYEQVLSGTFTSLLTLTSLLKVRHWPIVNSNLQSFVNSKLVWPNGWNLTE